MKEKKSKKNSAGPVQPKERQAPDDRLKELDKDKDEAPKIFSMVKEDGQSGRRDFLKQASKIMGVGGIAALSAFLSDCKVVEEVASAVCTCNIQQGSGQANASSCPKHKSQCRCDTVACACESVCTCNLVNGQKKTDNSNWDRGICTCNKVCSCNTVAPCTCDGHCTCLGVCSCHSYSGHYWYPN